MPITSRPLRALSLTFAIGLLSLSSREARAHFLFVRIGPVAEGGRSAEVYFSEYARAGDPRFVPKLAHTKLWVQTTPGEFRELKVQAGADRLRSILPPDQTLGVVGECRYGVLSRPRQPPFLLRHYPKAVAGHPEVINRLTRRPDTPFEIVAFVVPKLTEGSSSKEQPPSHQIRLTALRDGKPMPGVEFHSVAADLTEVKFFAGADGTAIWTPPSPGQYCFYVADVLKEAGELDGKHYDEIRDFATLTIEWPLESSIADPEAMAAQFEALGFTATHRHPTKNITRFKQGRINLMLNRDDAGRVAAFRGMHGPSASAMAFRVADPQGALQWALANGAQPTEEDDTVIMGIGGAYLYFMPDHGDPYANWAEFPGWREAEARNNVGLDLLDHLTHNVRRGQMRVWSEFYRTLFGFEEQKFFDIKDDKSQIEEFIREYHGEGIQHLALTTDDIYGTVEKLRARGVRLQDTIETYYELVDKRVPGHGEDLERLRRNRILIDGDVETEGLLLQIFTEPMFGPIFFEIIQRKGNEGFGNGNFQALFESIELDQIRRGVVSVDA